jgi:hypothetical protein
MELKRLDPVEVRGILLNFRILYKTAQHVGSVEQKHRADSYIRERPVVPRSSTGQARFRPVTLNIFVVSSVTFRNIGGLAGVCLQTEGLLLSYSPFSSQQRPPADSLD